MRYNPDSEETLRDNEPKLSTESQPDAEASTCSDSAAPFTVAGEKSGGDNAGSMPVGGGNLCPSPNTTKPTRIRHYRACFGSRALSRKLVTVEDEKFWLYPDGSRVPFGKPHDPYRGSFRVSAAMVLGKDETTVLIALTQILVGGDGRVCRLPRYSQLISALTQPTQADQERAIRRLNATERQIVTSILSLWYDDGRLDRPERVQAGTVVKSLRSR